MQQLQLYVVVGDCGEQVGELQLALPSDLLVILAMWRCSLRMIG